MHVFKIIDIIEKRNERNEEKTAIDVKVETEKKSSSIEKKTNLENETKEKKVARENKTDKFEAEDYLEMMLVNEFC